ncbi:MAG: mannosyltransferase family protein [Blastocatellia bacterium]|nr:mannosyltransferase family protein [Blastocatellia bacterium]
MAFSANETAAQSAPERWHKKIWKRYGWAITLFVLLRLAFMLLAIVNAGVSPEAGTSGNVFQRYLIQPWNQWDVEYFLRIASQGYRAADGTAQFHPLFPMLGRVAGHLTGWLTGGDLLIGLLLVSSVCTILFLVALEDLAAMDMPAAEARRAAFYFAHAPTAFILFAPYTESLFLLCAVLAFRMARRERWWMAGAAGAAAVLTRQQGLFLLAPLAWELVGWARRSGRPLLSHWRAAFGIGLIPLAYLGWLVYRALALGDLVVDLKQPRTLIYGLLISRSATQVVEQQSFMAPWNALWLAFQHLNRTTVIDLAASGLFVLLLALGGRALWRMRASYLVYSAVILLVSFSLNTGEPHPYKGLTRHCLLAFPLLLPLAVWGRRPLVNLLTLGIGFVLLLGMTFLYYNETLWLP